jgi:hypothetical protein
MKVEFVDVYLLPCPFCGSKAVIEQIKETGQYWPRCTGGATKFCLLTRKPNPKDDGFLYKDDAVAVWNMRD